MAALKVRTKTRTEFVDITAEIQAAVGRLGVKDGVVTVFCPHTTAGVTTTDFKVLTRFCGRERTSRGDCVASARMLHFAV